MIEQIDRIKRLKYRSFYTGTKETDLILGNFAEKYLDTLELQQLDEVAQMLVQLCLQNFSKLKNV